MYIGIIDFVFITATTNRTAQCLERRTRDRKVAGSIPGRSVFVLLFVCLFCFLVCFFLLLRDERSLLTLISVSAPVPVIQPEMQVTDHN